MKACPFSPPVTGVFDHNRLAYCELRRAWSEPRRRIRYAAPRGALNAQGSGPPSRTSENSGCYSTTTRIRRNADQPGARQMLSSAPGSVR